MKNIKFILTIGTILAIIIATLTVLYVNSLRTKPQITNNQTTCVVGGCNGEICQASTDEPAMSDCLWKEAFTCYKTAKCEVQSNGVCDWTQSNDLKNCISKNGGL